MPIRPAHLPGLETLNPAAALFVQNGSPHELFEIQATSRPDSVAVVHGAAHVTYADLNRRANRLARYLRAHDLPPETLVAIYVESGVDVLVCLLGTLKAGFAYLPLDPSYPMTGWSRCSKKHCLPC